MRDVVGVEVTELVGVEVAVVVAVVDVVGVVVVVGVDVCVVVVSMHASHITGQSNRAYRASITPTCS